MSNFRQGWREALVGEVKISEQILKTDFHEKKMTVVCFPVGKWYGDVFLIQWAEQNMMGFWAGEAMYKMNHDIDTKSSVTGRYHFRMWPSSYMDFKTETWDPRKAERRG